MLTTTFNYTTGNSATADLYYIDVGTYLGSHPGAMYFVKWKYFIMDYILEKGRLARYGSCDWARLLTQRQLLISGVGKEDSQMDKKLKRKLCMR